MGNTAAQLSLREERECLMRYSNSAVDCARRADELLRWAKRKDELPFDPEIHVSMLLEALRQALADASAVGKRLPARPLREAGIYSRNAHIAAMKIARRVLTRVAKAIDATMTVKQDLENGRWMVEIPGFERTVVTGGQYVKIPGFEGETAVREERHLAPLGENANVRKELRSVPRHDFERLSTLIDIESDRALSTLDETFSMANPSQATPTRTTGQSEGSGGDDIELTGDEACNARLGMLEPAERNAYFAYRYVVAELGNVEDREAHEFLTENGIEGEGLGELKNYKPPSLETFRHYLSAARRAMGESKYRRRHGRPTGKSVARADEIEPQRRDD